ncbi:hypothetical protein Pmani_008134 [Petrolisthes manimaculis]|uniref:G-protein coupled receptors family 2 profile 1 domain-containing protein n=1 Tax=Petrolisthes manimaculis TaxID=1843537 RepID=A0AAE1Q7C9_9EUCA|nr:hypothetical protein Pmani_008134 [Petrolisthes manimaculis]
MDKSVINNVSSILGTYHWEPLQPWMFTSQQHCQAYYITTQPPFDAGVYCNATFDNIMCWPPTPADTIITLPCPPVQGINLKQTAYRTCTAEGRWQGKKTETEMGAGVGEGEGEGDETAGWTNYTACFTSNVRQLLDQLYSGTQEEAQVSLREASGQSHRSSAQSHIQKKKN